MTIQTGSSTQLRSPMPDVTDVGKKVYIAALERRLLFYILRDIKLRACLELATGVPYDEIDLINLSSNDLVEYVAQDMAPGLDISIDEARARVKDNQIISNPD